MRNLWRGMAILGAFLLLAGMARAADAGDFARGNERYAAGDYAGAAKAYETQARRGEFSANLFYNLGDAYYRLNDRGRAILNYRRALRLEPAHAEAAANLAFIGGAREPVKPEASRVYWASVAKGVAWPTAIFGWFGVAALLLTVANRRYHPFGYGVAAATLAFCALGAGVIWYFDDTADDGNRAVVVTEAAPALYSPVDSAKVVTTLAAGGEVRVLSEQGAWLYVSLGDGTTRAWLAAKEVGRFVPK